MKWKLLMMLCVAIAGALALAYYATRDEPVPRQEVQIAANETAVEPLSEPTPPRVLSGGKVGSAQPMALTLGRLLNGEAVRPPSSSQLEAYLRDNGRSVHSLLGALRATGDLTFLHEAMRRYPNEPAVQYAAYFFATDYKSEEVATPERRKWLEALKASDPDNALPGFLSARDYFKAGQPEKAFAELRQACEKSRWEDYSLEYMQNAEEAFLAAGESESAAKAAAVLALPLPHLAQVKDLSVSLVEAAKSFRKDGDQQAYQEVMQLGLAMSERFGSDQKWLIGDLVGLAVERIILGAMDASAECGNRGMTVKERLDQLTQRRESLKALGEQSDVLFSLVSEQDLATYLDRWKALGEESAMRWALSKYGIQGAPSQAETKPN